MATIPVDTHRSCRATGAPERRRPARTAGRLGQSLAEFALTVPMALLMVLFGLDFGRVFLGWVALNQAAREAANYAAMNPTAWTLPYNLAVQAEYARLVTTEASNINCTLESPVSARPSPTGPASARRRSSSSTCQFSLITPLIGMLTGNPIPVSASSAFPIRSGNIEGVPVETSTPADGHARADRDAGADPDAHPGTDATPTAASGRDADAARRPTPDADADARRRRPAMCTVISLLNVQIEQGARATGTPPASRARSSSRRSSRRTTGSSGRA